MAEPAAAPHDRDPRPIGVFDSGVGGLTVVAALRQRLPRERVIYLGDTARLPYGTKSAETVSRYSQRIVDFLVRRDAKAIVIACNTASALARERLHTEVPLWDVLRPGAARAAAESRGRVGVIATESTVRSGAYRRALLELRPELEVSSRACPLFVPLVEEGWSEDPITEQVARRYLEPLLERAIDTLLLGCTHYPMLLPVLRKVAGSEIRLIDSASAVSELVAERLGVAAAGFAGGGPPGPGEDAAAAVHLCVTDASEGFLRIAARILGYQPRFEWVDV